MPSVSLPILPLGPMIDALVGVSEPRKDALTKASQPVPAYVRSRLLIDTGATSTCLDSSIIQQLALSPSGLVSIHTPSTNANNAHQCQQYDVSLLFPLPAFNRLFKAIPVVETNLAHQGIDGLLGRDVLAKCLLIYNGDLGIFTLSF